MEDRSWQTARESVSRTVCHTADIQRPEAHSHDQSVPGAGGLGKVRVTVPPEVGWRLKVAFWIREMAANSPRKHWTECWIGCRDW